MIFTTYTMIGYNILLAIVDSMVRIILLSLCSAMKMFQR